LNKKIILITGSTDGIGKEAAIQLIKKGAHVIIHARNKEKAINVLEQIQHETKMNDISYVVGDLSSFSQIKLLVNNLYSNFDKLDVLINNAGVYNRERKITEEELEETIAVNYIAPFYMTNLLLDLLKEGRNSRIVNVVSQVQSNNLDFKDFQFKNGYTGVKAYARSKTCLVMFTYALAEKLKKYNISVNCLHPGVINTKLLDAAWGSVGAPVSKGADSIIYAAISEDLNSKTGVYLKNNRIEESKEITYNKTLQAKLWSKTEEILDLRFII
jgi:NAD(P)-dependent dehydrogenase (short-subunit alcohol dehydrogenase family)